MNKLTQILWVIRAGKNSEAHQLFIENGLIVLARQDMGNLRLLQKERTAFYAAYASHHHADGQVAIRGIGGKFFRFIHEVCVGNLILYPCRLDKRIYFGEVAGRYFYDDSHGEEYPHRRKVNWQGSFPKSALSEFGKRELGAARTFFRFTKNVEELIRLIAKHGFQKTNKPQIKTVVKASK